MKHTLSVLVEDESGVLSRISGLFARRGFNIESLAQYPKNSHIILAANHRTYYDNFIVMTQLYNNHKRLPRRCLFPNRSTFYYDTFRGLFTNLIGTGLALFPPIYRQRHQYKFNRFSILYYYFTLFREFNTSWSSINEFNL